jgi:dethiobiotin synthetase
MSVGYFVTGTDTGVGKTLAACALIWALREKHATVLGMKAVAAGTELDEDLHPFNADVRALQEASSFAAPEYEVCPYVMAAPLSPHLAAELDGFSVQAATIAAAYQNLSAKADAVVVEGAGGFCVPLSMNQSGADLAKMLGLPVVLVVGMRLGCLNHAMLTAQAVASQGLPIAGWVANCIDPHMSALEGNIAYLTQQLMQHHQAPLLARLPHLADFHAGSAREMAKHFKLP